MEKYCDSQHFPPFSTHLSNGVIDRYRNNNYWERFYDNTAACSSKYYAALKGYDSKTEFSKLVESWNGFAFDISKSNNY